MADAVSREKRILVVEDEEVIANICCTVLEGEGFNVDIAADCQAAQKMINGKHYDLCLIDILIPGMSGKQLYHWLLEKHPPLANVVVFSTGLAMEENTVKFLEESGRPVLPKPFSPDELVSLIHDALR